MSARMKAAFLLLALAQAAHSVEEYFARLWEVFAPAAFLSSLVSASRPEVGFLVINVSLVALGFWCYFRVVGREHPHARAWIWFFVALESVNAVGHVLWAAMNQGYRPGLLTALPFLLLVPVLVQELLRTSKPPRLA